MFDIDIYFIRDYNFVKLYSKTPKIYYRVHQKKFYQKLRLTDSTDSLNIFKLLKNELKATLSIYNRRKSGNFNRTRRFLSCIYCKLCGNKIKCVENNGYH